jgi:hypothetical protein
VNNMLLRGLRLIAVLLLSFAVWHLAIAQPAQNPADGEVPTASTTAAEADPQPQPGTDATLDDYEASEQISEDLSVSFPVDI